MLANCRDASQDMAAAMHLESGPEPSSSFGSINPSTSLGIVKVENRLLATESDAMNTEHGSHQPEMPSE
jgi:hypothetical protein